MTATCPKIAVTPDRKPFVVENAACAKHNVPIRFAPATGQFFCPKCMVARFLKTAAAGKAVAS